MIEGYAMLDPVRESLWFYSAADYLVINAFLWRNDEALGPCLEIVRQNNLAVMAEAEEETPGKRFPFPPEEAEQLFRSYVRRTPRDDSAASKRMMLAQAADDIRLLCRAAKPSEEDMLLYRNVDARFAVKDAAPGGELELYGLTSTSTTGQLIDYGRGDLRRPGQIMRIALPAGLPALIAGGEENEVVLPPMRFLVTGVSESGGVPLLELRALETLDVGKLIAASEEFFAGRV